MPDRDFNPKDGGFIRIMNEFVDKLTTYPLDSNEWRVIMLMIRRTWGVKGRPHADIPWGLMIERTGLPESSLADSIKKLKDRNILHTLENDIRATRYKINSKVSTWLNIDQVRVRNAYRPKQTPTHRSETHSDPPESELRPTGVNHSDPPESELRSTGVTPIKEKIKEKIKDNIKDNIKDTPIIPIEEKPHVMTKKEIVERDARIVIDYINHLSGKNFPHSENSLTNIRARMKDGATLEQCLKVCQNKWLDPDHKGKYYRPITLFRPSLFESYLNENGSKRKPTNSREEARRLKWFRRYQNYGKESTGQGQEDEDSADR